MQVVNVKTRKIARIDQSSDEINVLIRVLTAAVQNDPSDTDAQALLQAYQGIQ